MANTLKSIYFLLFSCLVAALFITSVADAAESGNGLRCFSCNSLMTDKEKGKTSCASVTSNSDDYQVTCNATQKYCRTMRITVLDEDIAKDSPVNRVVRSCAEDKRPGSDSCYYTVSGGTKSSVCECKTDLCNSGYQTAVSSLLVMLMVALSIQCVYGRN